jgi:hypothetical protein
MRILLLTGGLYLLAAMPVAAQEVADSTRVFAVPAGAPAAPTMHPLFEQTIGSVAPSALPGASAAAVAVVMLLSGSYVRRMNTGGLTLTS